LAFDDLLAALTNALVASFAWFKHTLVAKLLIAFLAFDDLLAALSNPFVARFAWFKNTFVAKLLKSFFAFDDLLTARSNSLVTRFAWLKYALLANLLKSFFAKNTYSRFLNALAANTVFVGFTFVIKHWLLNAFPFDKFIAALAVDDDRNATPTHQPLIRLTFWRFSY